MIRVWSESDGEVGRPRIEGGKRRSTPGKKIPARSIHGGSDQFLRGNGRDDEAELLQRSDARQIGRGGGRTRCRDGGENRKAVAVESWGCREER
jgi:hypothetical protein